MNHSPKPLTKMLMLIICLMLMLTSCSLLPTELSEVVNGMFGSKGGDTVTISREEYELLQEYKQLAEMMDVSVQMISNLERGNKAIRIDNLINLSQILDVSTDYILMAKTTTDDLDALTLCISRLQAKDRNMIELLVKYCLAESI